MLISLAWLRALVPVTAGDDEIARRLTARGLTVDALTESSDGAVLDLDVPANRPDALGHMGVAREVGAAFGVPLAARPAPPPGARAANTPRIAVVIDDPALCGRYTAGVVSGVRVGPSPPWVVERLTACGLRPINNVVDASNLVMMELGQPVHFFDLAKLAGPAITVRGARPDERLTTLDGVDRALPPGTIVIADAESAVALGGIMGGAASQISESTKDVLIEAAWFSPAAVRQAARSLGMSTDASVRFERGCDPEAPMTAQQLAAELLATLAGGTLQGDVIDVRTKPAAPVTVSVRVARASQLLGYALSASEASRALSELGFAPESRGDVLAVAVPSWRVDLTREVDLIEEIGRHLGYERIPSRAPEEAAASPSAAVDLGEEVRDRFASLGFNEAFNYAMIGPGEDDAFVPLGTPAALTLANPIAETLGTLRRTLLPGLLRATDQNLRRGAADVRLFEVGGVFLAKGGAELPDEPLRAAFAWTGAAEPAHWSGPSRALDAWDAAGLIEDLLSAGAGASPLRTERCDLTALDPGRSIVWRDGDGRRVAWCGPLHPDSMGRLGISVPVWLGEADLTIAAAAAPGAAGFREIPRLPGTWRDLSLVLAPEVEAGTVMAALARVASPAPASLSWIDRYSGPPLPEGHVAMTLRVILQPLDRTLTDAEAEAYRLKLVTALDAVPGVGLRRMDT
jgi:phenylalanyl-tRNA synthetase beta chain